MRRLLLLFLILFPLASCTEYPQEPPDKRLASTGLVV
jgi:hypothetical protein